jgi:hypothetical protein
VHRSPSRTPLSPPCLHKFDFPKASKVLEADASTAILHTTIHSKPQRGLIVYIHGCSTIARSADDEDWPTSEAVLVNSIIGCSLQTAHVLARAQLRVQVRRERGALQYTMRPPLFSRSTRLTGRTLMRQETAAPIASSASTSTSHRPLASFIAPASMSIRAQHARLLQRTVDAARFPDHFRSPLPVSLRAREPFIHIHTD